jgi:hypothetical protein
MATSELETAIRALLLADPDIAAAVGPDGVYYETAPQDALPPYIVYQQIIPPRELNRTPRREQVYTYAIAAVMTTRKDAQKLAEDIDAAMTDASFLGAGWASYWCFASSQISRSERRLSGEVFHHEGGNYEIRIAF